LIRNRFLNRPATCAIHFIDFFNVHPIQPLPQSGDAFGPALAQPTRLAVIRPGSDQFVVVVVRRERIAVLIFLGELDTQASATACVLWPTCNPLHVERIPTSQFFEDQVCAPSIVASIVQVLRRFDLQQAADALEGAFLAAGVTLQCGEELGCIDDVDLGRVGRFGVRTGFWEEKKRVRR